MYRTNFGGRLLRRGMCAIFIGDVFRAAMLCRPCAVPPAVINILQKKKCMVKLVFVVVKKQKRLLTLQKVVSGGMAFLCVAEWCFRFRLPDVVL